MPFNRDKLLLSLYRSLEHRPKSLVDAAALTDTVINKLRFLTTGGLLATKQITQTAQVALNRFDKSASVHYQANHK